MRVTFEGSVQDILNEMSAFAQKLVVNVPATEYQHKQIEESAPPKKANKAEKTKPAPEPACPTHDQPEEVEKAPADLQAACMAIVNGDKAKKAALIKILAEYDCTTIKAIHVNDHDAFWARVKDL